MSTNRPSIKKTSNYRLFEFDEHNRPQNIGKHRKLKQSMQEYGFLPCYPVVVHRNDGTKLVVKDGQHRLYFAEALQLPVYYTEVGEDFDIARVNNTQKTWTLTDYAQMHAKMGKKSYEELMTFSERYGMTPSICAALLGGTISFGNIAEKFYDGVFEITDREWAEAVAGLYVGMISLSKEIKNKYFLDACMAVSRVEQFDPSRMLAGAKKCREKLVNYGNRDSYLTMLEDVYNFNRRQLVPIRVQALTAMRNRSVASKGNQTEVEA